MQNLQAQLAHHNQQLELTQREQEASRASSKAPGASERAPTSKLSRGTHASQLAKWARCNKSQSRTGHRRWSISMQPDDKKHIISNMVARNYSPARPIAARLAEPLVALGLALCALLVLASADQQQAQEQATVPAGVPAAVAQAASATAAALTESMAASASSNNYQSAEAQHQMGQASGKSKKIQIVYIKVPLTKLRPSLAASHANSSGSNYSETTHFNSQGSHSQQQQQFSAADEQQLMGAHELGATDQRQQRAAGGKHESARQPQSFLIPMALVQSSDEQAQQQPQQQQLASNPHQTTFSGELPRQPNHLNQQQHMLYKHEQPLGMGHAASQLDAAHMHPWPMQPASFWSSPLATAASDLRFLQQQQHQANGQQVGPAHGFMSSFLLGEKEKMTQAALRLQRHYQQQQQQSRFNQTAGIQAALQQQQQVNSLTSAPPPMQQQTTSTQLFASPSNVSPQPPLQQQQQTPTSTTLDPKGPGGLMPSMIAPLSRMPDNAIGQAYGAAVGMALPVESGSPTNLLGSSSTNSNYGQAAHQQARGNSGQVDSLSPSSNSGNSNSGKPLGGNSGTNGAAGYSSGTGSSTSYGANGQGPHASSSSAMGSPASSHAYDATAHSSGYGSGTSTSAVSGALSDYPAAQSTSSPYNHPSSQQGARANSPSSDADIHLKQAKKTIIPIVVQVEHALLGHNNEQVAYQQQQQPRGNRYGGNRSLRQLGGKRGRQNSNANNGNKNASNQVYGLATNEIAQYGDIPPGAQWINAANSYDINQITAQINAENAASAAAALAAADAAFAQGTGTGYSAPPQDASMQHPQAARPMAHPGRPGGQQGAANAYAAGLQNAASALLANTHPMIQAAASGGLASASKLGAKLGEMIALPSMQVPGSMASIGQSLPSALSSLTNQMGVQLGQAVQQAAKDHPTATAFARQVAQQAGIQLPNYSGQQAQASHHHGKQHPLQAASSQQHVAQMQSPQSQLQNLKLGIGHSLQTAASSLIGLNQKANGAASLLPQSPSSALNQVALTAALKQLSAISPTAAQLAGQLAGLQSAASSQQQTVVAPPQQQQAAGSEQESSPLASALQPSQQQMSILNQFLQQQQQVYRQLANLQQAAAGGVGETNLDSISQSQLESSAKPAKASSSFKSKFLSFFQAPKFITNLIGWNDRADARNDQAEPIEFAAAIANLTSTTSGSLAPNSTQGQTTASSQAPTTLTASSASTGSQKTDAPASSPTAATASTATTTANASSASSQAASASTAKMRETTRASTATPAMPTNATSALPKSTASN